METKELSHHDINKATKFKVDKAKHEAAKRKQQPKTKIQRLKAVFYILTFVWMFSQVCSALLCSTGFIHVASTKLNGNGILIIPIVLVVCVFLEYVFNKLLNLINSQKYDDETKVSPVLYFLLAGIGCIYASSSFVGSPYAVKFFAASPDYHNIELLTLKHDNLIKQDTMNSNNDIKAATLSANNYSVVHSKLDHGIRRIRSASAKGHRKKESKVDSLGMAKGVSLAALVLNKEASIAVALSENEEMEKEFDSTCNNFGLFLSICSLVFIFFFVTSFSWCAEYERLEVADNDSILEAQESTKETDQRDTKERTKRKGVDNEDVRTGQQKVGFGTEEPKEGDFVLVEGVKNILHILKGGKSKGSLVKRTKEQYMNMLNNCTNDVTIREMKQNLKGFS